MIYCPTHFYSLKPAERDIGTKQPMKKILLFTWAILLCSFCYSQANRIGWTKKEITDTFRIKYPEWTLEKKNVSEQGITYSNWDIKDGYYLVTYLFNKGERCSETVLMYKNEQLTEIVQSFNSSLIKAGKLKWINQDGSNAYTVSPKENYVIVDVYSIE